ncbi:cell ssuface protein containing Ig-like domain protein [Deinococcus detaillensis]|uniref:Cell ssuface protein containing Ig-like domain protein n=1 Tax=Deinococcus detaillensis TaxID=2592048 RepID=A0A553ULR1_9DEIO|nr:putative Ig domain-containing protein [Deinococcus detaillensis]TSA81137.1 cell ssuface protein containing Ig-like domain protein [Deinococcus detaillensis]
MNRLFPALAGAALLLSACGSSTTPSATPTSSRDILSFSSASLGTAYVGEPYSGSVAPVGGTGPYSVRLTSGTLPAGLKFAGGSSAAISGTPTASGSATFSLEVTDANLSIKTQTFNLSVADLPPLDFVPKLPSGEVRGETRIPITLMGPRGVRAARFTWVLPENTLVTGVQSLGGLEAGRPLVFWKQNGRNLTLDFGFRLPPKNASQVAMVSLKPVNDKAVTLPTLVPTTTSFLLAQDGSGKVLREVKPPEPVTLTPAVSPAADSATGSSVAAPTLPAPASDKAGSDKAATDNASTDKPVTDKPSTDKATTDPASVKPDTTSPDKTSPDTTKPAGAKPAPSDPAKPTPPQADPPKTDSPKTDAPKTDAPSGDGK